MTTTVVAKLPVQTVVLRSNTGPYRVATGGSGPAGSSGVQSSNGTVSNIIRMSQAAYDALVTPDPTTLYIITP
jgi:hypothetical protein